MIFSEFIEKTKKYLKTVRILKNYVSFDMSFPSTWVMLKKAPEGIEILQTENNEGVIISSFVCEYERALINIVESTILKEKKKKGFSRIKYKNLKEFLKRKTWKV